MSGTTPTPKAWMRKWAFDGVKPAKVKGDNGRWRWPIEMKYQPVTTVHIFDDDVPLFAQQDSKELRS